MTDILAPDFSRQKFAFDSFLKTTLNYGADRSAQDAAQKAMHPTNSRLNSIVCKHWLRGLCKKGDGCEFLHEYNLRRMPECKFFQQHGWCQQGEECLYVHTDPESRQGVCEWYRLGYCPLGPECRKKHIRKQMCKLYLTGFCPRGPQCPDAHPKWQIPFHGPQPIRRSTQLQQVQQQG
ncbi:RNA-binding component of cleavage and polyadenylation factor [Savitreella phatthalungensis]